MSRLDTQLFMCNAVKAGWIKLNTTLPRCSKLDGYRRETLMSE